MYSIGETSRARLGHEVTNEFCKNAVNISGDETIANAVLNEIINHFSKYEPRALSQEARNIKNLTRSAHKYNQLIKFIDNPDNPFILIVENKKNIYANKVQITTEGVVNYTLDVFNILNVKDILEDEEASLIQANRTPLIQHKSILVAELAMQAIRNTYSKIQKEETQKRLAPKQVTRPSIPVTNRNTPAPALIHDQYYQSNGYTNSNRIRSTPARNTNNTGCCTIS